ncbi:MAG: metallophosphoesterase, partial [Clostridia bacterium]|nr:metallophosphoesterase [Clostridia bacterium]
DNRKLMMIDDNLMPEFNAVEFDKYGDKGFVSSFMGSFAYYATPYNSGITDDDPGIVQVSIMEIYSDRITLTTKNYGEYHGEKLEPTPSVFERYNGDDSQIDVPLMRLLLFGDYQIGKYLLTDESNEPLRPVFVRMCEDLEDEEFDAVMIGGDLTYSGSVTKERWNYVVDSVLGMLKEKISPNIYIISGNHDYNAGERDNFNSADYYNTYMKENLGSLEENGNGYFEKSEFYDGDVLISFVYEQDGIYFMGLSTSPDMMRGSLQNTNYNYSPKALDWIEKKLAEIGEDKTILFTAHFPLGDSNNLIKASKGAAEGSTVRLLEILKDYPNLVYLYGHDHGSSFAYISSETEERVTRYDTNGYKID